MKVGSLVELVNDNWTGNSGAIRYPIKNKVYTVRDIGPHLVNGIITGLLLEEVNNPKVLVIGWVLMEPCWKIDRFRELQPPIANIEEHINENTLEPVYI